MSSAKKRLMAAVSMLTVSALMMTTASYAWFTISTNPEITGMTAEVSTNQNLEIALGTEDPGAPAASDTGDNTKWGNIITLDGAFTGVALKPAKLDGTDLKAPTYGTDGRVDAITALSTATQAPTTGGGNITVYKRGDAIYGFKVDYVLRTNVAGDIILGAAKNTAEGSTSVGTEGSGSKLDLAKASAVTKAVKDKIKVNFVANGTTTPAVIADDGTMTGTIIGSAVAGTTYPVSMYVYLDGENMTNADAVIAAANNNLGIHVQFANAGVTTAMEPGSASN